MSKPGTSESLSWTSSEPATEIKGRSAIPGPALHPSSKIAGSSVTEAAGEDGFEGGG